MIFYKRNLDSHVGNCIIILTEPTTPLVFHAQPGGIFLFMGCFMYQYPKQILTIEQQVQSYADAFDKLIRNNSGVVSLTAMNLPVDWKEHLSV